MKKLLKMEEDCAIQLCLPEFLTCSFLTDPLFWVVLVFSLILYFVGLNNFVFLSREARCSGTQWPDYLMWFQHEENIRWLWPFLVVFFIFLPTMLVMLSKSHGPRIKRCVLIGYILFILLFICMAYCLRFKMYPIAIAAGITIIFVVLWMIWLCSVVKEKHTFSSIYGIVAYSILGAVFLSLSVIIGIESPSSEIPFVCPVEPITPETQKATNTQGGEEIGAKKNRDFKSSLLSFFTYSDQQNN